MPSQTHALRREFRITDQDMLSITLLMDPSSDSHVSRMAALLVAMAKVRPDVVSWIIGTDGKPRQRFERNELEYALGLLDLYDNWCERNAKP